MNLRGETVTFALDGKAHTGKVQTRIRGTRWQVICSTLPVSFRQYDGTRRIVLDRREFAVIEPLPRVRQAASLIERMIDDACGIRQEKP